MCADKLKKYGVTWKRVGKTTFIARVRSYPRALEIKEKLINDGYYADVGYAMRGKSWIIEVRAPSWVNELFY